MAYADTNLAERSGNLVESHKNYDPRIVLFYFILAGLLLILASGLAYQQLFKTPLHARSERTQTQRRGLAPGPRGNRSRRGAGPALSPSLPVLPPRLGRRPHARLRARERRPRGGGFSR